MMKRFSASGERVRLACWLWCPAATNFSAAFFATDAVVSAVEPITQILKLARLPTPSPLTLATLP